MSLPIFNSIYRLIKREYDDKTQRTPQTHILLYFPPWSIITHLPCGSHGFTLRYQEKSRTLGKKIKTSGFYYFSPSEIKIKVSFLWRHIQLTHHSGAQKVITKSSHHSSILHSTKEWTDCFRDSWSKAQLWGELNYCTFTNKVCNRPHRDPKEDCALLNFFEFLIRRLH